MPPKKMAVTLPLKKAVTKRAERTTKKSEEEPASDSDKQSIAMLGVLPWTSAPRTSPVVPVLLRQCHGPSRQTPVVATVEPCLTPDHTLPRITPVRPGGF